MMARETWGVLRPGDVRRSYGVRLRVVTSVHVRLWQDLVPYVPVEYVEDVGVPQQFAHPPPFDVGHIPAGTAALIPADRETEPDDNLLIASDPLRDVPIPYTLTDLGLEALAKCKREPWTTASDDLVEASLQSASDTHGWTDRPLSDNRNYILGGGPSHPLKRA
jgi:hypothetical protein